MEKRKDMLRLSWGSMQKRPVPLQSERFPAMPIGNCISEKSDLEGCVRGSQEDSAMPDRSRGNICSLVVSIQFPHRRQVGDRPVSPCFRQ